MGVLTSFFLGTFLILYSIFYPIFKRPIFATYMVILLVILVVSFRLFQYLKNQTFAKKSIKSKIFLISLWMIQLYLFLMIIWYVLIHFKTYKIM